ncbi:hypothetical protein AXG93_1955s1040 [Marchantia polymorpha subsp. ruderalis]|uniref:Uncharacterized protein n=1 Tax=Marchantia polymorpha subsp. ruderalis TaxID=1480154 RepID=A0A176VZD3_MARPO|nr:hypothetical protein AXG93_1955s1040 [Marchantia polymorpha subsp. ruderalis]
MVKPSETGQPVLAPLHSHGLRRKLLTGVGYLVLGCWRLVIVDAGSSGEGGEPAVQLRTALWQNGSYDDWRHEPPRPFPPISHGPASADAAAVLARPLFLALSFLAASRRPPCAS